MHRARFNCRQRIGHAKPDVVVSVDADFALQFSKCSFRDGGDFVRQATAVRVAQHYKIHAPAFSAARRVSSAYSGVELVAVERHVLAS